MGATVSLEGDWHFEREEPLGTVHIWQKMGDQVTAELRMNAEQWDTIVNDLQWEYVPQTPPVLSPDEQRALAEQEAEAGEHGG